MALSAGSGSLASEALVIFGGGHGSDISIAEGQMLLFAG